MSDIAIISSAPVKILLEPLLREKGFNITESASITFVERGQSVPESGLVILFGPGIGGIDAELINTLSFTSSSTEVKQYIVGRKDDHFEVTDFKHIWYFRSDGNDVFAETANDSLRIKRKLYEIEDECRSKGFVRIGKSMIINVQCIAEIIPWFGGKILLKLKNRNEEVEIARNYVKPFKEYLGIK